jgi:hypothetical protein
MSRTVLSLPNLLSSGKEYTACPGDGAAAVATAANDDDDLKVAAYTGAVHAADRREDSIKVSGTDVSFRPIYLVV